MAEQTALIKEALSRFKLAVEATDKQRKRETDDLKFQVPEHQWDGDAKAARGATTVDGVQIPARPMLSIPKLDQPIQLILNQERAAHLGVQVDPLSEDADDDTAEVIQDLYRRIERDSRAELARSWAFDRAVKCGRGCYRVNTKYCEDGGHPFDQVITIDRLLYQSAVYFDPFAQEPDWSDGEWAFVTSWLPWDRYVRLHGESSLAKGGTSEFEALAEEAPEWAKTEGDGEDAARSVMVAEYWYVEHTKRAKVVLDDESVAYEDEVPDGRSVPKDKDGKAARRREVTDRTVRCCLLNGMEEIESWEWNGKYIPLIPVIGRELQPFDAERFFVGVIGPAKDAQRMFNAAASNVVEIAASEPKQTTLLYEGQEEGHEQQWQQAAIRRFPYLLIKPTTLNGEVLPIPPQHQADTSKMAMSMALLDKADQFIQAATTTIDQSRIEQMGQRRVAHQTINALQEQGEFGNSHYLHSLASISMTYEAKVVIDLMAKVLDRPGRVARILDFEDNARTVILNQPFTTDAKGRPKPVTEPYVEHNQPQPGNILNIQQQRPNVKHYDLTKGSYGVSVTIGKSWQTRLQQGGEEIGQILQSSPQLMPLIGPTYFKFRDFPGSKEIAELLKKMRSQQFPFLDQKDGEAPDAQALQAQLQAMQGQMQQITQAAQGMQKALETEQVKHAAQIETAKVKAGADLQAKQLDAELKVKLQEMQDATSLAVAEIAARVKGIQIDREAFHDAVSLQHQQRHEAGLAAADHAADVQLAELGAQHAQAQAEQGAIHGQMAAEQQAALQPTNGNGDA